MPVDTQHADYQALAPKWRRMRDVISGQDAVHRAGETYLPRLSDQTDDDYAAYRNRATWYGATARTIDAVHGLMFRKAPTVEAPAGMDGIVADITMGGTSAIALADNLAREVLEVGRVGVLADFPRLPAGVLTLGMAEQIGARPFATMYRAEDVINWRSERVANRMMLTLVVLREAISVQTDEFSASMQIQYRVLRLVDGLYEQQIYREGTGGFALAETVAPTLNGQRMRAIPFAFVGPEHVGPEMSDPPLIDMADLNLSHYRSVADYEHGAHFTGLPMLYVFGVQLAEGEKIRIGSQAALTSPDPQASAGYVEFTGQGLGALRELIDRKEHQMAALGASLLSAQKAGVEAADTYEMRTSHQTSMLADIAGAVSEAMTLLLVWLRDWARQTGDVVFQVSTDYVVTRMSAQDLAALLALWQAGGISRDTLYWNLQQGELVRPGKILEDEIAEIDAEGPQLGLISGDSQ